MSAPRLHKLSPVHCDAALLYAQGYTQVEIAEHFNTYQQHIQMWCQSPVFKEKVAEYQREIQSEAIAYAKNKLATLHVKAVDRLEHLMEHAHSEAVQLGATREVLERGPLRIQRGTEGQKVSTGAVILSKDMLIAMSRVAEMTGDSHLLESMQALPLMSEPEPEPHEIPPEE